MEFGLSEEQESLRDTLTKFLADHAGLPRARRFADGGVALGFLDMLGMSGFVAWIVALIAATVVALIFGRFLNWALIIFAALLGSMLIVRGFLIAFSQTQVSTIGSVGVIVLAAVGPSDLETAVRLANEFHLKFVLNHVSHSQPVLDYIAELKVPVIVGPIYEAPKPEERYDTVYSLPAQLNKRGVKIAFATYDAHNVRNLPYQAGFATVFGLPYEEALKAITINPAEIWGVADKLGSLDVGKLANIVVANGDPLDVRTDVKRVFIEGREIPLTSRQTQLRDQYSK